ncbi:hypothetical protein HU200_041757 [Digitaria exilis]|uniref:Uncharacterized protein n=1 Tax=Digitaria exilis TaxID=1010633 RepID=A0A835B762_9POAL|nr:hypothetical protein HU200_041757 [Digitaria exilis]
MEESLEHLFLQRPFAHQCWGFLQLQISDPDDLFAPVDTLKSQLQVLFFMDVVILLCWTIWMARNDLIFRGIQPTIQNSKVTF